MAICKILFTGLNTRMDYKKTWEEIIIYFENYHTQYTSLNNKPLYACFVNFSKFLEQLIAICYFTNYKNMVLWEIYIML